MNNSIFLSINKWQFFFGSVFFIAFGFMLYSSVVFFSLFSVWLIYIIYKYYYWSTNISKKRKCKNILASLPQKYYEDSNLKCYYTYSNSKLPFYKSNILFDYIIDNSSVLFNKYLAKSDYIEYVNNMGYKTIFPAFMFMCVSANHFNGEFGTQIADGTPEWFFLICTLILSGLLFLFFGIVFVYDDLENKLTFYNDPNYKNKLSTNISVRWWLYAEKTLKLPSSYEDFIIKDAIKLVNTFYYHEIDVSENNKLFN